MGLAEGPENKQILSDGGIPHFMYAEPAIQTLDAMYRFVNWLSRPKEEIKRLTVNKENVKAVFDNVKKREEQIY